MTRARLLLVAGIAAVALGIGLWFYGCQERRAGARDATIKTRDAAIDSLERRRVRVDTVYVADTARYRELAGRYAVLLARWKAATATVDSQPRASDEGGNQLHTTPATTNSGDSGRKVVVPPMPPGPAHVIAVADSTIRACSIVVVDCEARVAVRDSLIDSLRVQLKAERRKDRLPLFHVKLPSRSSSFALGAAAGVAAGLLLGRK